MQWLTNGDNMRDRHTEKDLAAQIIRYLQDMGWEIYQEVQMYGFGSRADIVALKGNITWVIETKMNAGLEVIYQAFQWQTHAHYVSIAVPRGLRSRTANFAGVVCKRFGIGLLECDLYNESYNVRQHVAPKLDRSPWNKLRDALNENHKTYAEAGNADGKFWSPFKQTCNEVVRAVNESPGMTVKGLIDSISHHYSSDATAKGSIVQWARAGKIKGIKIDEHSRPLRIYPESHEIPEKPEQLGLGGSQNE